MYLQQTLYRIHLCLTRARQIWGGGGVPIKNLPVPEVSFCRTMKGLMIESFINSSAVSKILTLVASAVTEEGKHHVIHMDSSAVLQLKKGVRSKIKERLNKTWFI